MKGRITMTPEEMEREKARRRLVKYCSTTCLCCLIIGFLLGVALDARYRPDNIRFNISSDSKISLMPKPGDIISFAADKDPSGVAAKITMKYTAGIKPCKSNIDSTDPTCVYWPYKNGPRLYLFGCTFGPNGTEKPCYDPQYGPKCNPCGGTGGNIPFPTPLPILHVVFWDIESLLGVVPSEQALPQSARMSSGGSQGSQVNEEARVLDNTPAPPPPPRVQELVAACYNGVPAVFQSGSDTPITPDPNAPITAEPSDTITWNAYDKYNITGLNGGSLNICANGNPSGDPASPGGNQSCIINPGTGSKTPYPYQVNISTGACISSQATTEYLLVETPTVPPSAKRK
jgi:hypothetical protein